MTVKTIYHCDKCGKEWDASLNTSEQKDQMCTVAIGVSFGRTTMNTSNFSYDLKEQQWCRTCVIETGFSEPRGEGDLKVAPETPMSFEDKVVEFMNELGFSQDEG